jgi:low affinity Fe/Cu permease
MRFSFLVLSEAVVRVAGHRITVAATFLLVTLWCAAGMMFGLPTQWFLLSNMIGTSVALFALLIMQHSQNRDMAALQVKVDELIRSSEAGNHMIGVERLEAEEMSRLASERQAGV